MTLLIIFSQLPSEDVTDSKSAVKNAQQNIATDVVIDASDQAINQLSNQSVNNACKDPNSTSCNNAKNSTKMIGLVWIIFVFGIIIEGLVGFSKWIIRTIEFVSDFF